MSRVFAWLEVTMLCCLCVIGGGCIKPDRNWERVWINSWDEIYNYGRFVELGGNSKGGRGYTGNFGAQRGVMHCWRLWGFILDTRILA